MIKQLKMPEPIVKIIETVCGHKENGQPKLYPPNLLIPINSGDGRTRTVRVITNRYHEADVISFSSRDYYLEFKLTGKAQNIDETHLEIQGCAEYANHYHGVISLDIDALLPHLSDMIGDKFFSMVNKVKRHATLIIFVPADCPQKQLDLIVGKIGADIQALPPVKPSLREMAKAFWSNLPRKTLDDSLAHLDFKKHEQAITEFISEVSEPTIRKAIELAKSMPFNATACKKLSDKTDSRNHDLEVTK